MPLTAAQLATLKIDIAANVNTVNFGGTPTAINALPNTPDGNAEIAAWYSAVASPDYWVFRTSLSKGEITDESGVHSDLSVTAFDWAGTGGYIARSQGERDAWREMFSIGNRCNPSLSQVRAAFIDIFSGSGAGAIMNRNHIAAKSRRTANRVEKLLKSAGTGTVLDPATMTHEQGIDYTDVEAARNLA